MEPLPVPVPRFSAAMQGGPTRRTVLLVAAATFAAVALISTRSSSLRAVVVDLGAAPSASSALRLRAPGDAAALPSRARRLSLGLSQYLDPKSSNPRPPSNSAFPAPRANATLAIYLPHGSAHAPNPSLSVLATDVLPRYGTGRLKFLIRRFDVDWCWKTCRPDAAHPPPYDETPCLAASRDKGRMLPRGIEFPCAYENMRCAFPRCKTMVVGDELCDQGGRYDVRAYYSSKIGAAWLPLGPRYEAWRSLEGIRKGLDFEVVAASKRKYGFNAIFTKQTNQGRRTLTHVLDKRKEGTYDFQIHKHVANWWHQDPNSQESPQLDTDEYMKVLLDSAFTVCPAGHNPECFRLYEAAEAGSIPVLIREDLYGYGGVRSRLGVRKSGSVRRTNCVDSLHHWKKAPVLVLSSWYDLFGVVGARLKYEEQLDAMQVEFRKWYDEFMRGAVRDFEDSMLE